MQRTFFSRACPLRMAGAGVCQCAAGKFRVFDEAFVKHFLSGLLFFCLLLSGGVCGQAQPAPAQEPGQNPPAPQGPTTQQPPPLPPREPDQSMPDEGKISVGLFGWIPTGQPTIDKGKATTDVTPSRLQFPGKPKQIEGADVTIPVGKHHDVRASYFRGSASGNTTITSNLLLWGGNYSAGDFLNTNYRLQNVKVSLDFLSWPYPLGSRRIRVKTLWQFQYAHMTTGFDAPLLSTVNGPNTASGNKTVYAPSLGLGIAYYVSPNFRLEANASGFAIPHHWTIWDADASAAYRFGKVELRAGGKAFHFRSSPQGDYYLRGTFAGGFVGLRYFLN